MKALKLNNQITVNLGSVSHIHINHLVVPAEVVLHMNGGGEICIFGGKLEECEDIHDRLLSYMGADTLHIDALGNYEKPKDTDDIRTQKTRLMDWETSHKEYWREVRESSVKPSELLKSSGWQEAGEIGEMLKRAVDENEDLRKSLRSRDETVYYLKLEIESRKSMHDDLSVRLERLEPLIDANSSLIKTLDEKKAEVNRLCEDRNNLLNENKRLQEQSESDAGEETRDTKPNE